MKNKIQGRRLECTIQFYVHVRKEKIEGISLVIYLFSELRWWSTELIEEIVHDKQETTHNQRGQMHTTPAIKSIKENMYIINTHI